MSAFCIRSGQVVNLHKFSIICSSNLELDFQKSLADILEFNIANVNSKYLGVPLIQGRVSAETFVHVFSNINSKLFGWKKKIMNLAGRTILIKSVFNALPSFFSMKIPKSILEVVDKERRFFGVIRLMDINSPLKPGFNFEA